MNCRDFDKRTKENSHVASGKDDLELAGLHKAVCTCCRTTKLLVVNRGISLSQVVHIYIAQRPDISIGQTKDLQSTYPNLVAWDLRRLYKGVHAIILQELATRHRAPMSANLGKPKMRGAEPCSCWGTHIKAIDLRHYSSRGPEVVSLVITHDSRGLAILPVPCFSSPVSLHIVTIRFRRVNGDMLYMPYLN
ncbi:hypothetical protein LIA77_11711 [Sarocladium implicatum]|nr:hypothetical protein LIA77_11711 [Sarocladium implicatum]